MATTPFGAPPSRMRRVSARVSMPADADQIVAARFSQASKRATARQLAAR
jgi:hypothetical protein